MVTACDTLPKHSVPLTLRNCRKLSKPEGRSAWEQLLKTDMKSHNASSKIQARPAQRNMSKKANSKQRHLLKHRAVPGNFYKRPRVRLLKALQPTCVRGFFGLLLARLHFWLRQQARQGFERAMPVLRSDADVDGQHLGLGCPARCIAG